MAGDLGEFNDAILKPVGIVCQKTD